jgi:hypothetical protein
MKLRRLRGEDISSEDVNRLSRIISSHLTLLLPALIVALSASCSDSLRISAPAARSLASQAKQNMESFFQTSTSSVREKLQLSVVLIDSINQTSSFFSKHHWQDSRLSLRKTRLLSSCGAMTSISPRHLLDVDGRHTW